LKKEILQLLLYKTDLTWMQKKVCGDKGHVRGAESGQQMMEDAPAASKK
jgi:hypothetical protein